MGGVPDRPPPARGPRLFVMAVAAVAGACTMVVELSAVRLLAPWFGTSAAVWTNVIGVILFALALGYLLGARLAAGEHPLRSLASVLGVAAVLVAWTPGLAAPIAGWFLPAGLRLHQAAELWLWGSLAATLGLFFVPAALLGCVGPLLVEVLHREGSLRAGSAGGRVLCASTLGSLAGTFATTHVLIPRLGLSRTFLAAGAGLLALALWSALARRGTRASLVLAPSALLVALALGGSRAAEPPLPGHLRLLASLQSPYQALRVVEDTSWEPPMRLLQVNEGLDSFQSVWAPRTGLLGRGFYYDYFALPAWWARASGPWKVLVLGLGAGTTFRVLEGASPPGVELEPWGVEIDAAAVELGRLWFDLDVQEGRVLAGQDARAALERLPGDFDLIVLDAYAHQVEIPAHLCSLELFERVRQRLAPGGWLAVNVGAFGPDDPVLGAVGRTVAAAFAAPALAARVPFARNWIVYARAGAELPAPGSPAWAVEGPVGEALLPPLGLPGATVRFAPGSEGVLVDDRNPIELLQRASLEQGRARLSAADGR